ncbi:hypothetical protein [Enterococcus sp. BWR-S5]|uniref:hypothetical protein n=1 Tax=Enterococcus sp. BWR-S5 TaxID=2787714 RepID=UPI0019227560|nr:hypothetical protein [Enterococcus sp. BWR-S5]MBL1226687.1 hypothetical protein [Enterococcus sp. BWR-S5]
MDILIELITTLMMEMIFFGCSGVKYLINWLLQVIEDRKWQQEHPKQKKRYKHQKLTNTMNKKLKIEILPNRKKKKQQKLTGG